LLPRSHERAYLSDGSYSGETLTKRCWANPGGNTFCGITKPVLVAGQLAAFHVPAFVQVWRLVETCT
jgi:hypothetical protein